MSTQAALIAANLAAGAAGEVLQGLGRKPVRLFNPEGKTGGAGVDMTFEAVEFDAVVTVTHRRRATVTRHPVEQGADISDHTKPEPREIDLSDAIVSNTPAITGAALRRQPNAAETAFGQIEAWRFRGTPLTLVTDLDVYDNVVIESFDVPRDAPKANSMHAQLRLVEVRTVATTTVKLPKAKDDRNQTEVNKGAKSKTKANSSQEEKGSVLVKALKKARALKPAP